MFPQQPSPSAAAPGPSDELLSLVYSSHAVVGFDLPALQDLLHHARAANAHAQVTGLLLFKDHRFLQLLEGPAPAVREKMRFIAEDPRHHHVRILLEERIPERFFPEWTMGYAADDALDDAAPPGYRMTFADIDAADADTGTLPALRELIRWFRTTAGTSLMDGPAA